LTQSPVEVKYFGLADTATLIPGGTGTFSSFTGVPPNPVFPPSPIVSASNLAFFAEGTDGERGIYGLGFNSDAGLVVIADRNTPMLSHDGNFDVFLAPPSATTENVILAGQAADGFQGIYSVDFAGVNPGPPTLVADMNTPIPGGSGNFASFPGILTAAENRMAFVANGTVGFQGIYVVDFAGGSPGPPNVVTDMNTAIPGGVGNFTGFSGVSVDSDGHVAFIGLGSAGQKGIYLTGSLEKVIDVNDTLDDKDVMDLKMGRASTDSNQIAFVASFADGSQGVYLAFPGCETLEFTGFLDPIGGADATGGSPSDPLRAFKLGSTVPIKMILTCNGQPFVNGVHTLKVTKVSSSTTTDPAIDASPTDAATTSNQFRLTDGSTGEWHFNLDSKATHMTKGIWKMEATLSDGTKHSAYIELK
jgi:hypothetical protein